jgi:hypothetical protein
MSEWAPPARSGAVTPVPGLAPTSSHHRIADATDDWPEQAADAIVNVVDAVRDRTTGPAVRAAHALVLGLVVLVLAAVLGVALLLAVIRGLHIALDNVGLSREMAVWTTYAGLGFLFTLTGSLLLRRRSPKRS